MNNPEQSAALDVPNAPAPFDPDRPFLVCHMGSGSRTRTLEWQPEDARLILVIRTHMHGKILERSGFQWADLKAPYADQPMRCIVTVAGLPRLGHPTDGDYLIANDCAMLTNHRTKVYKFFRNATKMRRFCITTALPNAWRIPTILKALGVHDKGVKSTFDFHASRFIRGTPSRQFLAPPDDQAVRDLYAEFMKYVDRKDQPNADK